jgi:hypothetical protein
VNVRVPSAKLILDGRDLATTAGDSCSDPLAFFGDFVERAAVPVEHSLFAGVLLPAPDDDIYVLRIELRAIADAPGLLGGDQRRPTSEERVVATLAGNV